MLCSLLDHMMDEYSVELTAYSYLAQVHITIRSDDKGGCECGVASRKEPADDLLRASQVTTHCTADYTTSWHPRFRAQRHDEIRVLKQAVVHCGWLSPFRFALLAQRICLRLCLCLSVVPSYPSLSRRRRIFLAKPHLVLFLLGIIHYPS